MLPMRQIEHAFSELLRRPKRVTGDVERGDVLLRRRGEPDLRLTRADRDAERAAAFVALGRTLRNLAMNDPKALESALGDALPWLEFLPANDRREFVEEFSRVVVAAAELDSYLPVSQLITEWRATAEIHADPSLSRRLRRPVKAQGERVQPPRRLKRAKAT